MKMGEDQILQLSALSGYQMADIRSSNSLRMMANKMLEGTFKIGASTINRLTRELLAEYWPEVAAQLPTSENEVALRYDPPFMMGAGVIVNQLRSANSSDYVAIVERARSNAAQVVDDLFANGVYGWIVNFLEQSKKHEIMNLDLYRNALDRLDTALRESGSPVCRWHREEILGD